jgi:hypothetical protein
MIDYVASSPRQPLADIAPEDISRIEPELERFVVELLDCTAVQKIEGNRPAELTLADARHVFPPSRQKLPCVEYSLPGRIVRHGRQEAQNAKHAGVNGAGPDLCGNLGIGGVRLGGSWRGD